MASSTPVDQNNTTEVSDCPQCGSVCVGAFILPCGHLVCRKCLRDHYGLQLTCSICQQSLTLPRSKGPEDFTSLVQQLGVDPVMVQLVDQWLRGQGRQSCVACENRDATSLCHDCSEHYCDGCAKAHRRQRLTKDHVLQTLPQALHNASSAACAVSRPRTDSASSTDSLESIRNPMDQPTSRGQSRGTKQWKQWVKQQVGLLQAALSEQDTAVTSLTDVMYRVQKLLAEAQARQQLLQTYVHSLPSLAVTEHSDGITFTVTFNIDDVSMHVQIKMDALQNRLRDVIRQKQSSSVSDVTSSVAKLQDLQSKFGVAAPSTQINRPEQTTRQKPKTAPTQPAVLLTSVLVIGIITGVLLHTCLFSPSSSSPLSPQRSADVLPTSTPSIQGQGAATSPPTTTTTTTSPPTTTTTTSPTTTTTTTTSPPTTTTTTSPPTTTTTTTYPPTTTTTTTSPPTTTTTTSPPTTTTTTSPPTVDPIKATPRRVFSMTPACGDDKTKPWITSIVSIEDGQRLVMSDSYNSKVKVVDMHHPHKVSASLTLNELPWSSAVLPDKLIAVTTYNKVIYLLQVTETMTVTSRIITDTEYSGIAGHSDGNLIVSTGKGLFSVARIDILNRNGRVVRTIADGHSITQLVSPWYLYLMDNQVYVSDYDSHAVFKVDLNTGQLLAIMTHTELKYPRQITADASGHLYIASWGSGAVLVRSPSGQWRKLVEASQHSDGGFVYVRGVCVTSSGRLVVAWVGRTGSIVIAYDL